jgi:riboflavin kinase/FMN adenylyltransferase
MLVLVDRKNPATENSVCAIGGFDGVHRGHQKVVSLVKQLASTQRKTGIITFSPLPFFVLQKAPVYCLTPNHEKEEIFHELGIHFIYYFGFSKNFAQLSAEGFVDLVVKRIKPSIVVVGENFRFGTMRKGNAKILKERARTRFHVEIAPRVVDDGIISSTRIRELLLLGHVKAANRLLGREYSISGTVIKGRGRGQTIGFPTINIQTPQHKLMPLDGVYKVKVVADHQEYLGAMFCRHDLLEVHIIGFSGDLYGRVVTAKFLGRIRGIEEFTDDGALKSAIAADIKNITS